MTDKTPKPIPAIRNEDKERQFWWTHDSTDDSDFPKNHRLKIEPDLRYRNQTLMEHAVTRARNLLLSHQCPEGYWWYTLEANESINAERIFLNRYLGLEDRPLEEGLANRLMDSQREDGSWPLYHGGPGDLSTTIECYFAVKMVCNSPLPPLKLRGASRETWAGRPKANCALFPDAQSATELAEGELCLEKARGFILAHGGLSKCRVFTRIHLAMFGLVPWDICPAMPPWLILLPSWFPVNVYEFSSWARASIIPLLVIQAKKKVRTLPVDFLDELFVEADRQGIDWSFRAPKPFSTANAFILIDRTLHFLDRRGIRFLQKKGLQKCEEWIRQHIARTEDIYPAMAYGAMALHALGYPISDPTIQKCLKALDGFLIRGHPPLHPLPSREGDKMILPSPLRSKQETSAGRQKANCALFPDARSATELAEGQGEGGFYQQCCISPVWDAPWAGVALLEAGMPPDSPEILKCGRWLISKQIRAARGDWAVKNRKGIPGGWSFEFENDFFPDVDDTIQVVDFLQRSALPESEKRDAIERGLQWILSMQSKNGGWAAFDVDNSKQFLNRIPFADHGACLDPPTPDITARAVGLLSIFVGAPLAALPGRASPAPAKQIDHAIKHGIRFLENTQEPWGGWWGRWGVNYIYGTWCVLDGLFRAGYPMHSPRIRKAVAWLKSIQNRDGGFGESCESYLKKCFVPLSESVPSQTAWGLMGLVAAGEARSPEAKRAADWLKSDQRSDGSWDEPHHTGTGFPGHFYIRYHGYRYYFPLLALARFTSSLR